MNTFMKFFAISGLLLATLLTSIQSAAADECFQLLSTKQYELAFSVCKKAAMQGDANSQYSLGFIYVNGYGVGQSYKRAISWFLKAAMQGNKRAQHQLGMIYANEIKNYQEAEKWYKKAAEQGDADSQNSLGVMYYAGNGVARDYKEAKKWFLKAAEKEVSGAQFNLGLLYEFGRGVTQNYKEAAKWYLKAAKQGEADAQYNLAQLYRDGKGVTQDYRKAEKWYRKAAEQGVARALYTVGFMYYFGQGITNDYQEAESWFRKAAEQDDAMAQYLLGVMHDYGQGVPKSSAAAADWYYKSGVSFLKQGNNDRALKSLESIRELSGRHATVPNMFLADKLMAKIYGADSQASKRFTPGKKESSKSYGTGWVVSGSYVVTNHHVIAGKEKFTLLRTDGEVVSATVIMRDKINDLALLKVNGSSKMPRALRLASMPARIGERVFTVGYPHPAMMGTKPKLTDGTVSAATGVSDDPRTYQISVPLQAGNSGGPLLNMDGEVVGIVTSKLSAAKVFKWTGDMPQNVNYAVKSPYLSVLLSTAPRGKKGRAVSIKENASLADLVESVKDSVVMVIAE